MRKKVIFILAILTCIVIGILMVVCVKATNIDENYLEVAALDNSVIENTEAEENDVDIILENLMYADNLVDMDKLDNLAYISTDIVIAQVTEVLPADNYYEFFDSYGLAYTPSIVKIKNVIKGDAQKESEVKIIQDGGVITIAQYERSLCEAQKTKFENNLRLSDEEKETKYISEGYANDADKVKKGETYLLFLSTTDDGNLFVIGGTNSVKKVNNSSKIARFWNKTSSEYEQIDFSKLKIDKNMDVKELSDKIKVSVEDKKLENKDGLKSTVTDLVNDTKCNQKNVLYKLKLLEVANGLNV